MGAASSDSLCRKTSSLCWPRSWSLMPTVASTCYRSPRLALSTAKTLKCQVGSALSTPRWAAPLPTLLFPRILSLPPGGEAHDCLC